MKTITEIEELAGSLAQAERERRGGWRPRKDSIEIKRWLARGMPAMAGGAPNPVHPLGPPSISGTDITVDTMLNNPTRVTRMIMDLSLQRFIIDRVFSNAGSVSGGAVVYDQAVENELYADRDVQLVEPGAEFPTIEAERRAPGIAPVEKWGGKVWIPDEAKDRNQTALFTNKVRQLTNTIIRKQNQRAMDILADSISASGQTTGGNDWSDVVTGGSSQSNADLWPARDFALASQMAEEDELGVTYTLILLNPQEWAQLITIYGAQGIRELLAELNLSVYVSNRVGAGTALFVAEGQVGEMRIEKPLGTETWRQPERERTWVQASVRPVAYVTNPYAILEFTALAGS